MSKVKIMAHRGASYHAPENTAAAFKKAYDFNVDGIETDLQLTKDVEIVIHHNYYIDDTSDGRGAILTKTLEELKQYDFGKGEKILTLAELLPILDGMDIINLELKSPLDKEADYVGKVLDIVSKSGMKDKIIYSSFDERLLGEMKKRNPKCRVGLLTSYEKTQSFQREFAAYFAGRYPVCDLAGLLNDAGKSRSLTELVDSLEYVPDYLHPDYKSVLENPALVAKMHERGIGVNPYTCDKPDDMRRLVEAGCDGIITNRPDVAMELTQKRG